MRQVTSVGEVTGQIEEAVRNGTDAQLRANGGVMPPTVYILAEDLDQPYVGYLTCRPFYRGADASRATAKLVLVGESRRGQARGRPHVTSQ